MAVLADAGLHAIAADLIGFGHSGKPAQISDDAGERLGTVIAEFVRDLAVRPSGHLLVWRIRGRSGA